jgi:hypothetical protein
MDKERALGKSVDLLDELARSVAPPPPPTGTEILKACKGSMDKSGDQKKAYLGEAVIPEKAGAKVRFTGEGAIKPGAAYGESPVKPGSEKVRETQSKMGKAICPKCGEKDCKCVNKAVTARSIPRLPRALQQEMIRRNAQNVMTRGNSRFAKDIHTGPLTGEVVEFVEDEAQKRTHQEVYKACGGCGRRYKLFKGVDSGCPTCGINKSTHCDKCSTQLVKSHGGIARCPLCG